jgi:predicted ATP-grasp superfamily ATP-dependent carboligase
MFVIISELPTPPGLITELARSIVEWCNSKNAKLIVALGGIPIPNRTSIESPESFAVEVGDKVEGIAQKAGISQLRSWTALPLLLSPVR